MIIAPALIALLCIFFFIGIIVLGVILELRRRRR